MCPKRLLGPIESIILPLIIVPLRKSVKKRTT